MIKPKKTLKDIKLGLPKVPDITEINKLTIKRNEKIQKEIIESKDKFIEEKGKCNCKLFTRKKQKTTNYYN